MDKWLLLAGGNTKLTGQLIEIDERLRAEGITSFYQDIVNGNGSGELAEMLWRFAERRKALAK